MTSNNNNETLKQNEQSEVEIKNLIWRLESKESTFTKEKIHFPTISLLSSINVCPRCIFRYLDQREMPLYQESSSFLHHVVQFIVFKEKQRLKSNLNKQTPQPMDTTDTTNTTTTTDTPITEVYNPKNNEYVPNKFICCTCLGVLQNTNDKELFLDEFMAKMSSTGYEFRDYSLALTLPSSMMIREYSTWYYLKQNFPEIYKDSNPLNTVVDIKEAAKWILGPLIIKSLHYRFKPQSDFKGKLEFLHEESNDDNKFLLSINPQPKKRFKSKKNKVVNTSLNETTDLIKQCTMEDFIKFGQCPALSPKTKFTYTLFFRHENIYIAGRYNKYARDVTQTPWAVETPSGEKYQDVSNIVCKNIQSLFQCESFTFSSSGREDVDVRMLGSGRPFFIEIVDPHKIFISYQQFRDYENTINQSTNKVRLQYLQSVTKKETNILKDAESSKQKNYRCVVWTSKAFQPSDLEVLKKVENLQVKQNTPIRVLHRRSLAVRDKSVSKLDFQYISPHFFVLDVIGAQAGTYIKEFVHGDLGRTLPNVGTILNCETDILQLDVLDIDTPFPGEPKK